MSTDKVFVGNVQVKNVQDKEGNDLFSYINVGFTKENLDMMSRYLREGKPKDGVTTEWCNVKLMKNRDGVYYMEIDTWEPTKKHEPVEPISPDDLPF